MSTPFRLPIQQVTSNGLTAWLVEDHSVPVVSLSWSWPGGAAFDAPGREGTAGLALALLTEGAGDMPAAAFPSARGGMMRMAAFAACLMLCQRLNAWRVWR